MDKYGALLILFAIISFTKAKDIDLIIQSNGRFVDLKPEVSDKSEMVETKWNIRAKPGCKLLVECSFLTRSCLTAMIKIYTGDEFYEICPENLEQMNFRNASFENAMTVTIDNAGRLVNAKCKVRATRSYLNEKEIEVDSSEHGWAFKTKKKPTCSCGWANKNQARILGGTEASINEFPFIVRIKYIHIGTGFCGGTIISNRHVLTAAHCVYFRQKHRLSVLIGEHNLMTRKETSTSLDIPVESMKIHPEYDEEELNDIAILVLKETITFNTRIGPACMPKYESHLTGQYVKVLGWGLTEDISLGGKSSPVLRKVNLRVIDPEICRILFDTHSNRQMCTYSRGKEACYEDSGGPVIAPDPETNMFKLVGVVSYGGRKCGSTDPGVSTNVGYYIQWIRQHVQDTHVSAELCY